MPPAEQLAVQAIQRLASDGYASQLMKLRRPLLNELGRRLVTPGNKRSDTLRWLNDELAGEVTGGIDDNAFYRFAGRFGETYDQVWGELASQLMLAELSRDPAFDEAAMRSFAQNRVMHLISQELLTARTPADLDTHRLNAILSGIRSSRKLELDAQKLAIDRDLAEHRAAKIARERDLLEQRIAALPEQVKALQARIDEVSKRAQRGESIPASFFADIRGELEALATAASPGPAEGGAA